jgi:alginate O-acetyltransferase complex protein AlgI
VVFNSWVFLAFLIITLFIDGLLRGDGTRNSAARKTHLLLASYVFYGWWNWTYLGLIIASTLMDFYIGRRMRMGVGLSPKHWLWISLLGNLGSLAFFKYTNFLISTWNAAAGSADISLQFEPLDIILPVGISFFTFQALSYTIDVYRGELEPRQSLLDYALFIAFFPQLVAGPIVRAIEFFKELDFPKPASAREINLGLVLIVLGLVKKMAIADSLSAVVDPVFAAPAAASAQDAWLAVYAYALQIYCDFSGYTDTAIGCALLFGFRFPDNFNYPYAASTFQDFWRRWHMTLSRFLRDYLYIALGGNRKGPTRTQANLMLTMILGGLWHGASWTFVFWGFLHGAFLVLERVAQQLAPRFYASTNPLLIGLRCLIVFHGVCFAWIFFRASNFTDAIALIQTIASVQLSQLIWTPLMALLIGFAVNHFIANRYRTKDKLANAPTWAFSLVLALALCAITFYSPTEHKAFIYFQF